jgi:helix-turn-helix protein
VEVKIGIQSVPRELVVETDARADEIEHQLANVLADGAHSVFTLPMTKGGKILVPGDKIAYVEFGAPEARRVGFGNIV